MQYAELDPEELQKDDEAKAKEFDARRAYVEAVAKAGKDGNVAAVGHAE
jgi:hypothetical protein